MTRKYNTAHPDRGRSNYPRRLAKRGLSKAPQMRTLESLRAKQERQEREAA
jgi:hypothetical protein